MPFEVQLIDLSRARVLPDESDEELPLASLRSLDDHVHGALVVLVDGIVVPHIGSFGPDEACIGDWVHELSEARRGLLGAEASLYDFDECEQGQPAFRFQRVGGHVEVSIVASASGAAGDPAWGTHSCSVSEFDRGISSFLSQLSGELERASPGVGRSWVERQQVSS